MKLPTILIILALSACTTTKHKIFPKYGYAFQPGDQLVIAQFLADGSGLTVLQVLSEGEAKFRECSTVDVIPLSSVQEAFYQNLQQYDVRQAITSTLMYNIHEFSGATHLLAVTTLRQSVEQSLLTNNPDVQNQAQVQFTLYDLRQQQTALVLTTEVEAMTYGGEDDDGTYWGVPMASAGLSDKATRKSLKKLFKACRCE